MMGVTAALWLAGCTWTVDMRSEDEAPAAGAADPFLVEAELFYPERIALPGDAEMLVAADAVGRDGRNGLTRFSTRLKGSQVPIPLRFSVEPESPDAAIYELSAAILSGSRLLRLTGPVLIAPGEGVARVGRVRLRPALEAGFGQAWRCESTLLQFGAVGEHAFLAVDERLHSVKPVPADSGVRYQSRDETGIGIHETDGEIAFTRGGETVSDCRRIPALEAPLSGGGNEPGWQVEVGERRIELTSDYGQTHTVATRIHSGSSGLTTRFRATGENGPMLAAFGRRICRDSATGMPHPYTVSVQFEGGSLDGCGGRPRDLLIDGPWRVTRLGDEPVPEDAEEAIEITLSFDADGRVSGRSGCNRYTAGYELSGEGLSIETPAATKMACPEPRMSLESRFLQLLDEVQRFDIGPEGELVLIGRDRRITAVPRDA